MTRLLAAERQSAPPAAADALAAQIAALDWASIAAQLDTHGCATTGALLTPQQCAALAASYASDALFRSRVVMARHGFGRGEYKYFAYPLPEVVAALRAALYPPLAEVANRWNDALGIGVRFPLAQGEGVIFPVHHRPVQGTRGTYRVNMRHGVSRLRAGRRHTLGIIFHDGK